MAAHVYVQCRFFLFDFSFIIYFLFLSFFVLYLQETIFSDSVKLRAFFINNPENKIALVIPASFYYRRTKRTISPKDTHLLAICPNLLP